MPIYAPLPINAPSQRPKNLHLLIQVSSSIIYFVDHVDPTKLYKQTISGTIITEELITTRSKEIGRACHDRDNNLIYFVDSEYDRGISYIWSLDYGDSDSITEEDEINADVFDIFLIGSDIFLAYYLGAYALESGEVDPESTGTATWDATGAPHHAQVNDGNDATYIYSTNPAGGQHDYYGFGELDISGYDKGKVYKIRINIRAKETGLFSAQITVAPYGFEEALSPKAITIDGAGFSNYYAEWDNLDWDDQTLNGYCTYTSNRQDDYMSETTIEYFFYGDDNISLNFKNLTTSVIVSQTMGSKDDRSYNMSQITVVGDKAYFLWKWSDEQVEIWEYDSIGGTVSQLNSSSGLGVNTNLAPIHQRALTFDGTNIIYFILGTGEVEEFTVACVLATISDGEYFTCSAIDEDGIEHDYYVWFDLVGDSSGDPSIAGREGIRIDISGAGGNQDVSDALQAMLNDHAFFTADNDNGTNTTVTIACLYNGNVEDVADGDTGLTINKTNEGVDNTYNLHAYDITGDSYEKLGEYNIALMLDRNTDPSENPPFNLEIGFGVGSTNKLQIFQISQKYNGQLNKIADLSNKSALSGYYIVALTNHFIFFDNS